MVDHAAFAGCRRACVRVRVRLDAWRCELFTAFQRRHKRRVSAEVQRGADAEDGRKKDSEREESHEKSSESSKRDRTAEERETEGVITAS